MQLEPIFLLLSILVTLGFFCLSCRVDRKLSKIGSAKIKAYPKVSIIIPAHNKASLLKSCIDSAKNSDYPNKQIFVVNDCSTDNTKKILEKISGIKVFTNKKRLGKAFSLNNTAKKVGSGLILFLDADTVLEKNALEKLISSYMHYNRTEGKIGFISPKYKLVNKKSFLAKMVYMEQAIHQFLIKIQMNLDSIISIRGCCLLVNKKAFFAAGGFSDHILEDGDFAGKIREAGYKIKYEPRASVETDEPETINDFFRSRKRYGKGGLFCLMDHTKHFLFSKQALLTFYPYAAISILFAGLYLFANIFSQNIFFLLFSLATALGAIGLASTIGLFLGGAITARDSLEHLSIAALFLPYIFIYAPLSAIGYLRGVVSGIKDKLEERGKLKLNDW